MNQLIIIAIFCGGMFISKCVSACVLAFLIKIMGLLSAQPIDHRAFVKKNTTQMPHTFLL